MKPKTLRPGNTRRLLFAAAYAVLVVAAWALFAHDRPIWGGVICLLVLATVKEAVSACTTYIRLETDALVHGDVFKEHRIDIHEIEEAKWEWGCGAYIRRRAEWMKLPEVGNIQSTTNSIKAWLKRNNRNEN